MFVYVCFSCAFCLSNNHTYIPYLHIYINNISSHIEHFCIKNAHICVHAAANKISAKLVLVFSDNSQGKIKMLVIGSLASA